MKHLLTTVAAAAILMVPGSLEAQAMAEVHLGGTSLSGDDFEGAEFGPAAGAALTFGVAENVHLGVGFDWAQIGVQDSEEDVTQIDITAQGHYLFPGEGARFFVGGKAGYAQQSVDVLNVEASSNGFTAGPTVGVVFPLSQVNLKVAGDLLYLSQGDVEADGETFAGSDTSGLRWALRAGVSFPLSGGEN